MPKKPIVKKPAAKVQPAPVKPPEPSKRVVFQLFECLTKLDVAGQLVDQVGIFPGERAESLKRQTAETKAALSSLVKSYREEWFKMKGEVEA